MENHPLFAKVYSKDECEHGFAAWQALAGREQHAAIAGWIQESLKPGKARDMLSVVFGNSPYLARLLLLYPEVAQELFTLGPDAACTQLMNELFIAAPDQKILMRHLRIMKGKLALLVAMADIGLFWPLEKVTGALAEFAERSLTIALDFLLLEGQKRGEISLPNANAPSEGSGIIVLGMGKLGGKELNYSSDIDLIIFFEREKLGYKGRHNEQHFMNKMAHELVQLMQERTADGYVFRTDLRLRPDPASTPPAVTVDAALYYYESVGQNWERAAMIKARPVAGDRAAGEQFMKSLTPFMWRRSLDFAAINDIHSIKRQMDTRQNKHIQLKGHNIKIGIGGIREIEFFVQIHQLIWGGREPFLRTHGTCETLVLLQKAGLIDAEKETILLESYRFLRVLEHRLQMVADAQTHTLPDSDADIGRIAYFMGYDDMQTFSQDVLAHLHAVHDIYASSFRSAERLGDEGNLVFTGASHDPETLKTLRQMGYNNPETVSEIVMGWHHGSRRATRTKRARELITELMPTLLKRLGETANPDAAFLNFNEFLCNLPAGVQLFSLFNMNPELLGLIADIMGSAPTLAETLSKSPELLDAVLYADFYNTLPTAEQLTQQWQEIQKPLEDFEERMDGLRNFRNEKQFQAGVQCLKQMITAQQAGEFLASLADVMVNATVGEVEKEFARTYGTIAGSKFAIIALGKLGSREMTFSSDIDLVFVYDVPDFEAVSSGEKGFTASVYYNRLSQRLLNALSGMGRSGRLYEVDTRLRPSGKQGLLAVSRQALAHYFDELAWTFEYMAFTKARVIVGDEGLKEELDAFILAQLAKSRDLEKLRIDAADMRERTEKEHATTNPWDIKYVRGGLMDVDFIAQYLLLKYAPEIGEAISGSASAVFRWLTQHGKLESHIAEELIESDRFMGQIFNMLRLCSDRTFDEQTAPPGLKKLLAESVKEPDFSGLKSRLMQVEQSVYRYYIQFFQS